MSEGLLKPEYLQRPSQLLRRIWRGFGTPPETGSIRTPWGARMQVRPRDALGLHLWHLGVVDLPVTEVIWRLLGPGDTAVDVGANIGFFAGLMAARVGRQGRVFAYEPHPDIFRELQAHAEAWRSESDRMAPVEARECAASDAEGTAELCESAEYAGNRGTATLERVEGGATRRMTIRMRRLDDDLADAGTVSVMKVDVEGHEAAVFRGARGLLTAGRIRHVVFEEHHSVPSPATELMASMGYTLFKIGRTFHGPVLTAPEASYHLPVWLPPNILATREPERVQEVCGRPGWDSLRGH